MSLPPVVFLSSIDWNDSWQRHQIFATALAERGHRVLFVENTVLRNPRFSDAPRILRRLRRLFSPPRPAPAARPGGARVHVIPPLVLPPTNGLFRWLNAAVALPRLARKIKAFGLRERPLLFVYSPSATNLRLVDMLRPRKVIYDCASNFRGHPSAPADVVELERDLLERSEMVLTDSDFLYERLRSEHPSVRQVHQGVPQSFFLGEEPPAAYRTACYFGTIHDGLDWAAIRALGDAGVEVALIGAVKHAPPPLPRTVRLLPSVPASELPAAIEPYDVLLLPYVVDAFNAAVVPAKLYECLATNKPVLASALPSLEALGELVYVARTPSEWTERFGALSRTETAELRRARRGRAKKFLRDEELGRLLNAVEAEGGRPAPRPRPESVKWLPGAPVMAAVAVLARAAAALLCAWKPPFPSYYFSDAIRFDAMGWQTAQAMRGLAPWPEFDVHRRGFQTFIGYIYLVVGHQPLAAQFLICILGGLAAWLLYRIGRELAGEKAGLAAGWAFALCPSAVFYGSQLLKDPVLLPSLWLSLAGLIIGGRRWTTAGLAGTALAIAIRPASGLVAAAIWGVRGLALLPRRGALAFGLAALLGAPALLGTGFVARVPSLSRLPEELAAYRKLQQFRDYDATRREIGTSLFPGMTLRSWSELAAFIPRGAVYTTLMPLPGLYPVGRNKGRIAAAGENVAWLAVLLIGALAALYDWRRLGRRGVGLIVFIAFSMALGGLFDLDLGASARHKLHFLPLFLVFAAAALSASAGGSSSSGVEAGKGGEEGLAGKPPPDPLTSGRT